jgi:RHH-type rel operon transcriptional repressor/antitoxin RelB
VPRWHQHRTRSDHRCPALATGRSKQFFLKELIAHGMDDLEDIYLACLEVERLQRGESSTRSLNAVIADLELDD